MEDALKRNVRVRIIYGIGGQMDTDNERLSRSQAVISGLCHSFQKYGDLFTVRLDNAHEKLLLCDDSFMLVGSFNLLSFDGNYEQDTRKEMMYYFENPEQVTKARNTYFDF
jgi:phosphatidylserine/phosphatidylglycerophosphate/cardiolipin synthase-like enzyme